MGRAFRYQRRLAHIIVTVAEKKSADTVVIETGTFGTLGEESKSKQRKKAAVTSKKIAGANASVSKSTKKKSAAKKGATKKAAK